MFLLTMWVEVLEDVFNVKVIMSNILVVVEKPLHNHIKHESPYLEGFWIMVSISDSLAKADRSITTVNIYVSDSSYLGSINDNILLIDKDADSCIDYIQVLCSKTSNVYMK